MSVDKTLEDRASVYGSFADGAVVMQNIKRAMRNSHNWDCLDSDQREALEMVASKIGRILNGDKDSIDQWHDCAGYMMLVEKRLKGEGCDR